MTLPTRSRSRPATAARGFSLVEALVALVVVSICGMVGMSVLNINLKSLQAVDKGYGVTNVNEGIRATLGNNAACFQTFGGMDPTGAPIAPLQNAIWNQGRKNAAGVYVVAPAKVYELYTAANPAVYEDRNVRIMDMKLGNYSAGGSRATLTITYAANKTDTIGSAQVVRNIDISTTLDATNKITACASIAFNADGLWSRVIGSATDIQYSAGRVGIGVMNPSEFVHVSNPAGASAMLMSSAPAAGQFWNGVIEFAPPGGQVPWAIMNNTGGFTKIPSMADAMSMGVLNKTVSPASYSPYLTMFKRGSVAVGPLNAASEDFSAFNLSVQGAGQSSLYLIGDSRTTPGDDSNATLYFGDKGVGGSYYGHSPWFFSSKNKNLGAPDERFVFGFFPTTLTGDLVVVQTTNLDGDVTWTNKYYGYPASKPSASFFIADESHLPAKAALQVAGDFLAGHNVLAWNDIVANGTLSAGKDVLASGQFSAKGDISTQGSVHVAGNVTAQNVYASSDRSLKTELRPLVDTLAKLGQLAAVSYRMKSDPDPKHRQIGFVAQDVEKVFPEFVGTDDRGMKAINYSQMVAVAIDAVQALAKREQDHAREVRELRAEVEALARTLRKTK